MSKKTRFKLEDLRVESFLTRLEEEKKDKVKGGCPYTMPLSCPVTIGCTVSHNPVDCCIETVGCTVTYYPLICCVE